MAKNSLFRKIKSSVLSRSASRVAYCGRGIGYRSCNVHTDKLNLQSHQLALVRYRHQVYNVSTQALAASPGLQTGPSDAAAGRRRAPAGHGVKANAARLRGMLHLVQLHVHEDAAFTHFSAAPRVSSSRCHQSCGNKMGMNDLVWPKHLASPCASGDMCSFRPRLRSENKSAKKGW